MQTGSANAILDERKALEAIGIFSYEVTLSPEPRIDFVSQALVDRLGMAMADLLADPRRLLDFVEPELRARLDTSVDALASTLEQLIEVALHLPDGGALFLRQTALVTRNDAGCPIRIRGVVHDVTGYTQAQQALRESEFRYGSLLQTAPFGVILHCDGRAVELNPTARALLGVPDHIPDEDVMITDYLDPAEALRVMEFAERQAAGLSAPSQYESIIRTGDGNRRHILVGVQPITHQGRPSILASLVDISERKKAEEELVASRTRFQSIVETAPEGLFVKRDDRLLYANEACLRLLGGVSLADIIGAPLHEFVEDYGPKAFEEHASHAQGQVDWTRVRAKRVEHEERYLELAIMSGEFMGDAAEFGILRDVSMQVRFQNQLEHRLAFESLMCQVSTQFINAHPGDVDQAVAHALGQLGLLAEVDRCFLTMITPDLHQVTEGYAWARDGVDPHNNIMQGDSLQAYPYAARCLLEDGLLYVPSVAELPDEAAVERDLFERQGVLSTIVLPLFSEGVWRGFFGFETVRNEREWSDEEISALRLAAQVFSYAINRKHTEEERQNLALQMQTAQKMESLGVLVGGVAHDFNNLLTGILGNASIVLQELQDGSTAHNCVEEMERAAKHAAQLVRQMLIYAGRGKATKRHLDINHLVEDIGHLLRTGISKKTELRFELDDEPRMTEADETQLRQIVMNLITNAAQAIGNETGVISMRTGARTLARAELRRAYLGSEAHEGNFVFVEVEDTGCGMSPDVVERMFDPFFTSKPTGTGLGLAATLGIVRAHGGAIEVDTTPGKGTRIAILLPSPVEDAAAKAEPEPSPGAQPANSPAAGLVLIVDDEPVVRKVARRILERGGYTVIDACDGKEGLDRFEEARDQLVAIVMDMAMPVMDGEQAFRAMRALGPVIPVVFSSGFLPRDAVDRLLQEPETAFVAKPYRPSRLLEVLSELLAQRTKTAQGD